ncbi:MAG: DUF6614 family protein [Mesorhizobium sp.]
MTTMHGLFHLRSPDELPRFKAAYDAFAGHLQELGYVSGWRLMRRSPHDGYDARPPEQPLYVAMDFPDLTTAQACYAYVEADQEPLKALHRAVNREVHTTQFFLCELI